MDSMLGEGRVSWAAAADHSRYYQTLPGAAGLLTQQPTIAVHHRTTGESCIDGGM
ncbi:MAG TPA: hypothetical protein VFX53_11545 [Pedococcus sp.]|nr:hypothetical protein [Pedococcus sp.]